MPPKALTRSPAFDRSGKAVPADLFPADKDGIARVRFSLGTTNRKEADARRREIGKLWTWRAWDVLHGIMSGGLDVGNVAAQVKAEGEGALVSLRRAAAAVKAGATPTLDAETREYMEWYATSGRKEEHSVKQTRSRLKLLCSVEVEGQRIGSLPMDGLSAPVLEKAINKRWTVGATREAIRNAASGLYSWSIEEERRKAKAANRTVRWDENPASLVEPYERRPRFATAAENQAVALLHHAELHQAAYVRAFLHMGLREDELIHSRLHLDLDPETWVWRIQGRGPDDRHGCVQCKGSGWTPKGSKRKKSRSWRTLLVPASPAPLRSAVLDYLEAYPCEAGDFLFRNPRTGRPWDAKALDDDFKALCKRAGVTYGRKVAGGITLHDLRATCATRLVQAKERESVIAALLGDTVETIVRTYVRLTEEDTARAVSNGPSYHLEGK